MAKGSTFSHAAAILLVSMALLVAGCSVQGTYPDYNGPRNGDGFLIDPHTGLELPGQADPGL